jgi:hypothetical protein
MWGQLFPLFQINQAIWAPDHHNTSFFWHFLCQTMVGLQLHVIHNYFDTLYVTSNKLMFMRQMAAKSPLKDSSHIRKMVSLL